MRSKTSFFDKRVSLHLLRRFWPLWLAWLAVLTFAAFSVNADYVRTEPIRYVSSLRVNLLTAGEALSWVSFFAGTLMAMAMLSYLYFPRDCGLMNSLPLRRETVYFTAVLTGLVPMLLCDALACALLWALYGRAGVGTRYFVWWFEMVALANAGFYGCACFCGTLTGHVLVLPAVYTVLSLSAAMFEGAVRSVFSELLYGYHMDGIWSEWLSPLVWFTDHRVYKTVIQSNVEKGITAEYAPQWTVYLAGLCAVGLVLAILGVLIVRRRHMESAGEIVAVPVLRPVFRVCMTLGCGLGIPMFWAAATADFQPTAFAVLVLEILVCAAIGYFVAEMLIKKTLRVFDHGWKQLGLLCACLLLFLTLTKLDVLGYETHIPEASEIESVELTDYMGGIVREPETIAAFLDFQRGAVEHRAENRNALPGIRVAPIRLVYQLKNGRSYQRRYLLPYAESADPDSDLAAWERALNLPELRLARLRAGEDWTEDDVREAWVETNVPDNEPVAVTRYQSDIRRLSPAEALSLYREGILPDAEAGNIGYWHVWDGGSAGEEETGLSVTIYFKPAGEDWDEGYTAPISTTVLKTSENTLKWLRENLDLEPIV